MAESAAHDLAPSPEQRRIAAQQCERARQAISAANYDYGIELLRTCCKLDPANLIYRQTLRQTEKLKYKNNLRGSLLAGITTASARTRLRLAMQRKQYRKALEIGEEVLRRNPWHTGAQLAMSEAAEQLGLIDLAVWILEQARQKNPKDRRVNRPLAERYEKQGNFKQAILLWDLVHKDNPKDEEAGRKGKDLAATHTIKRGHYEEAALGAGEEHGFRESETAAAVQSPLEPRTPRPGTGSPSSLGSVGSPSSPSAPMRTAEEARLARQVEPLRARITSDPTNAGNYLQLAAVYEKANQPEKARETLNEGLGPTGLNFDIQIRLAELEIEPFRENLRLTDEKLKENPQDEELRRIRARLLKEINVREMEIFRQKAERYPSESSSRLELGIRMLRAGHSDEAITQLQQARKDPRSRWKALLYLGYCFKSKNNWPLAKRNFEEAMQGLPQEEDASRMELFFQLAQGAAEAKDWVTAIELGNELANLDFSYRDIGKLLDDWHGKLEQSGAAEPP